MSVRILFAAGGTGGHIFPAVAVADACRAIEKDAAIEFVGTRGRLEERVVPRAGYRVNYLWISGLGRALSIATLLLPLKIVVSFVQALLLVRRFRADVVVCAGAYVSYPMGLAARFLRVPLVLMESNALPGKVIRKLAPRATEIHVSFDAARAHLGGGRVITSGNPVRGALFEACDRDAAREGFGLRADAPTLFVFGGSQGSRSINNTMDAILPELLRAGIQVIWQTGAGYAGGERKAPGLHQSTFIHEMERAYAAADLIVARAGATTIAELAAVRKPGILIPLPTAADDHQRVNAEAVEAAGAGRMVLDAAMPQALLPLILDLMNDPAARGEMAGNIARMAVPDAHVRIARSILAIARAGK